MPAHSTSFEDMTFTEPRTVLFAVGQKESIDTKLSWRWARDQFILPSDQIWLVHTRKKQSGWIPLDSVKVRRRPLSSTPCSQQFPFREERSSHDYFLTLSLCFSFKTLSDVSLAKDWLPAEIAQSIQGMQHKLIVIDTTHDPGEALLKFISLETPRDAMLIMGSRGRQGWQKFLLGSVSSYVVQYAPIPLLVVRSRKYRDIPDLTSDSVGAAYLGMTTPGESRTVAVAVDGSASSLAIIKWACKNAFKTNDQIHILHSAVDETPIQMADVAKQVEKCMAELAEFQKDEVAGNATSVLLDIKGGDLRDLIVDYVSDLGGAVDLLVMGTRGIKGNLKRAVMGSVSSYCLSFANCPVLVVPSDIAREAAGPDSADDTPVA
jgi:nucleotide-binding universal stress UspA family protein|tara:strand:- start:6854 stop:7984 length:1131 start_codon:yes stop_codon:yes gene_type:complete